LFSVVVACILGNSRALLVGFKLVQDG